MKKKFFLFLLMLGFISQIQAAQTSGMIVDVKLPVELQQNTKQLKYWIQNLDNKKVSLKEVSKFQDGGVGLQIKGRLTPGSYYLYAVDKKDSKKDIQPLDQCFEILAPSITTVEIDHQNKSLSIEGMFFGLKPKVYLKYQKEINGKVYKAKCKIQKDSLLYSNPFSKSKKKYPMNLESGISSLRVKMPKLKTPTPLNTIIVVEANRSTAAFSISLDLETVELTRARGKLISYNVRDQIKAKNVWTYLVDSLGDNFIKKTLARLLLNNTKLSDQSYHYDLDLFTIVYWTIDAKSNLVQASGVVILPKDVPSAPLLSFQHGTMLMKKEAPSMSNSAELSFAVTFASAEGLITAVPDHLGLGIAAAPNRNLYHPYCQANPIAYSDADMLMALPEFFAQAYKAKAIPQPVSCTSETFLCGYSEGGYATLGLHRELDANTNLYNINVTACSPMAGPYSLSQVMLDRLMADQKFPVAYFAPYLLVTMNTAYNYYTNNADYLTTFDSKNYAEILPPLIDGYHSSTEVNNIMPELVKNVLTPTVQGDLIAHRGLFYQGLKKNDLIDLPLPEDWSPKGPVFLLHGKTDDCVLVENSNLAMNYFNVVMNKQDISYQRLKPNALIDIASAFEPTHVLYAPYAMGECWSWFHDVLQGNATLPPTGEIDTEGDTEGWEE